MGYWDYYIGDLKGAIIRIHSPTPLLRTREWGEVWGSDLGPRR